MGYVGARCRIDRGLHRDLPLRTGSNRTFPATARLRFNGKPRIENAVDIDSNVQRNSKIRVADEEKKSYYTFIHDESERLSRLIPNVLQLSRISRGNTTLDQKEVGIAELLDVMQSKVASQIDAAGFNLVLNFDDRATQSQLMIDVDAFSQIMINLVDNALKFTPSTATQQIDIGCAQQLDGSLTFTVRDYGKGIAQDQMRKIFELFYRPDAELTRETVGTGIGLALVSQLVVSMSGKVDVRNCDPGAEFSVRFPPL